MRAVSKPLSDNEAHERLVKAREVLGDEPAETLRSNTALRAARIALGGLQFGLVKAMDENADTIDGVTSPESGPRE